MRYARRSASSYLHVLNVSKWICSTGEDTRDKKSLCKVSLRRIENYKKSLGTLKHPAVHRLVRFLEDGGPETDQRRWKPCHAGR